jgi:hypothetical protein
MCAHPVHRTAAQMSVPALEAVNQEARFPCFYKGSGLM